MGMNVEHKILLVRLGAGVALAGFIWLGWWMDYRWKHGPQGSGFLKVKGK